MPDASIIVADSNNHCLRRILADGTVTTFIPAPFTEGQAANARQWGETVAVDDDGNIYLGMNGNKGVERYAIR